MWNMFRPTLFVHVLLQVLAALSLSKAAELTVFLEEPSVSSLVQLKVNQSRSIELVLERSYIIQCKALAGGFGSLSNVWFKGDTATSVVSPGSEPDGSIYSVYAITRSANQWDLVLNVFDAVATGTYSCRGNEDNAATLVIGTSNPTVIASTPNLSLNAGSQGASIPALFAFVSGNPHPQMSDITWTFNGSPNTTTGPLLLLPNLIKVNHAGRYTCTVQTTAGNDSADFIVTVNVQPEVALSPSERQVLRAGSPLSLLCTDSVGMPHPMFVWGKDDEPITGDGSRVQVTNPDTGSSTLTISSLEPGDTGQYSCTGSNGAGSSTQYITLEVEYAPVLESASSRTTWIVGETLRVEARLVGANPNTTTITWYKDNVDVSSDPRYQFFVNESSFSLDLPNLIVQDEGQYELRVENTIGVGSVPFNITVESPPTLAHTNGQNNVYIRNSAPSVSLSLSIQDAKPPVVASQIEWSFAPSDQSGAQVIDLDETRYSSMLTGTGDDTVLVLSIQSPVLADSGEYNVSITHSAGTAMLLFQLFVLNPPEPPTNISATPLSSCSARITWDAPLAGTSETAPANYIIIESLVRDESVWVELGRVMSGVTSLEARLPGSSPNTLYQLRGRSGSDRDGIGEGMDSVSTGDFMAYPEGQFPTVQSLVGFPASPTSIRVAWSLPDQDCFNFSSQTLSCSREGGPPLSTQSVDGSLLNGVVSDLSIDTLYNCTVKSVLTDSLRGSFDVMSVSAPVVTFTYPDYPPRPEAPKVDVDNLPTPSTITVNFQLATNHEEISHYQVIVLRLTSDLPTMSPDQLYPPGYQFDTYADVHDLEASNRDSFGPYIAAEISGALFSESQFVIGNGLRSNGSTQVYLNDKLSPGTSYSCFLRAFPKTFYDRAFRKRKRAVTSVRRQYDIFSSSGFLEAQKTDPLLPSTGGQLQSTELALVIGVTVAVLVILAVSIILVTVIICCLRVRRRRNFKPHMAEVDSNSTSPDGTPLYLPTPDLGRKTNGIELKRIDMINPTHNGSMFEPSGPIDREDFSDHVEKFDASRQLLFQEEFEWITSNSPWHPAEASNNPLNDEKNRYHNITAFDHTRVKLSTEPGVECSDYVNANYILGFSGGNEYIATQGPLEQTVVEFWKMVWEQNTATIVMLTNLVELGKVKCTQYWPINGTVIYGGVKVTLEHIVELPDYTIRNLSVSSLMTGDTRVVLQFHYTRWPDYGTPKLAAPLLNFLRAVNVSNPPSAGPVIIHCSAGVGRSGTVITIDYCLRQLKTECYMNPRGFVSQMRNQRNYMVQTDQQYTFLHYALLEAIIYGDTSFELSTFSDSYQQLQEVNPVTGRTLLDEEFGRIGTVKTMTKKSSFQQKIRAKGAPQRHFNSSFMGSLSGSGSGTLELYSAHFIDTYSEDHKLIVSDGPNEDTAAKWWQMVWDEDAAYIVMLTPQDVEDTFTYWPEEGGVVQHGNIVVEVESESAEHLYTCRQIRLTNAKVEKISHSVQHWQFIGWTTQYLPRVPDFVAFVCDIMKGIDTLKKTQRVLIHDIESLGPSGIVCSLYYCIERLRTERMVDVFQAVQSIKLQRPGSVKSVQEYAFIYDCVYEFIQTHSDNTNS